MAFEPSSDCGTLFRRNLVINGLADSPRLELSTKLVCEADTGIQTRLDALRDRIEYPALIKVDVDGGEEDVLKGASALNASGDVRWLIETHSKQLELNCIQILSDAGFETRVIPNAAFRVILPEQRPIEHNRWLAAWKTTSNVAVPH
jgi:hypothetical protein